jgi:transglutaminase-like putative cysteine protease
MLLKISHTSTYHYDTPVPYALQRLHLVPQSNNAQTVHDWQVTCVGAHREVTYKDGFNNVTELVRHERGALEISITASGSVTTNDNAGVFGSDNINTPLWMYSRQTKLTQPGEEISALAGRISSIPDELARLHELMAQIGSRMAFVPGQTNVETTAEDALIAGHGVCQDHAQVFVATARLSGLPARYVSGYLRIPDVENQAASHAWAEAHVQGLGWVGFDPANQISPNEKYVRVAVGLDYRDAAPISGIRHGMGIETLDVAVKVEQ